MTSRGQYLLNAAWSWAGAVVLIINGLILSPYLIRHLGIEINGIWVFAQSLVEYFWMIDLGVRPATTKLVAEYRALEKWNDFDNVVNTALLYSAAAGLVIFCSISFNTHLIARFFHISHPDFPLLMQVVSLSWALGLVFNIFTATLEGLQRFDVTNHIFIGFLLLRGIVLISLVHYGYGLRQMAYGLLITQLLMYVMFYVALRRIHPLLRLSPRLATRSAGREIVLYAWQLLAGVLSVRILNAAIPSVITRSIGVSFVTYYSGTQKVLDYAAEGIGRIGNITGPRASDWMARGLEENLRRLAEYGNRYCLMLWLLFATFLLVYATPLFQIWVSPRFAVESAPLLRIFLFGYTLWLGQFASAAILMGVGRYSEYSASLLIEALIDVAGFAVMLPVAGLKGAVAVFSVMIFVNRCLNLSRIYGKEFKVRQFPFLWRTYRVPLAIAAVDVLLLWLVKTHWMPGHSWTQLIFVGAINGAVLAAAGFVFVLDPYHRDLVKEKFAQVFARVPV
jgi:O-antigen/teichoic acid export membrane protein